MPLDMNMLDRSIDDIEELPGFEVPVNGVYLLKAEAKLKEVNKKSIAEISYEVMELIEQDDPEVEPTKIGTKFSTAFFIEGDDEDKVKLAFSNLKKAMEPYAEHTGEGNLKVLLDGETIKDMLVQAKVKRRADKTDKEKFYANVTDVRVQ